MLLDSVTIVFEKLLIIKNKKMLMSTEFDAINVLFVSIRKRQWAVAAIFAICYLLINLYYLGLLTYLLFLKKTFSTK